jgi:hypothetical protein
MHALQKPQGSIVMKKRFHLYSLAIAVAALAPSDSKSSDSSDPEAGGGGDADELDSAECGPGLGPHDRGGCSTWMRAAIW